MSSEMRAGGGGLGAISGPVAGAAGGKPGSAPAVGFSIANNSFRDIDSDQEVSADSVRQYGNQAVYARRQAGRKEQLVVTPETAELDIEKDKDKIEVIERFTEPYFALVKANSAVENQILSDQRDDEQLLIKLRGKNYLVK